MTSKSRRLVGLAVCLLAVAACSLPRSASALDTPNVLMGIDAMTLNAAGLFVDPSGAPSDGFNTFRYFAYNAQNGRSGRYKSVFLYDQNVDLTNTQNFLGISHNARSRVDGPDFFNATQFTPIYPVDLTNDFYPLVDRNSYGQIFDPSEYQIEVKFKPILAADPWPVKNEAHTFRIGLEQIDGYVWDAEVSQYKRADELHTFTIGTEAVGINDWYSNPATVKDADGFATYTVPLVPLAAGNSGRGHYHLFGDGAFRTSNVVTGGGRALVNGTWTDVTDGLDPMSFGGGATDPARPNSQLRVPNGVPFIQLQSVGGDGATNGSNIDATRVFSIELRSAALKRINPNSIMARIDSNSGVSFRFGDGLQYATTAEGGTATPISSPVGPLVPNFTDQITRFDQNGMTNLFIQPRTAPDPNNSGYRFFMRTSPLTESFDGTKAVLKIRAKLTQPLSDPGIAQNMTIYARDLDGNDATNPQTIGPITIPADPKGADEYSFNLALNQFNTSTFTTVTVNLSQFALNTIPMGGNPAGPLFSNTGDSLLTDFNLFEFGAQVASGGGLVRMELEYMQIEVPPAGDADFDDNNIVDGRDFLIWQRNFGGPGTATTGDANGDNLANTTDFNLWKTKFGGPPASDAAGAGVPEPASTALAMAALAAAVAARRRERAA